MCYNIIFTEMYGPKSYTCVVTMALYHSGNDIGNS